MPAPARMNRSHHTPLDSISYIWRTLDLPGQALKSIALEGTGPGLPSSFKVGHLAQATIALAALTAALIHSHRNTLQTIPRITVPLSHACLEFRSERFYTLNNQPPSHETYPIGGLHRTSDGHVRIHEGFPHHRAAALKLIGCPPDATRDEITSKLATLSAIDLETRAPEAGAIIAALRSPAEWDATPQAQAVSDFPVHIQKITTGKNNPDPSPNKQPSPDEDHHHHHHWPPPPNHQHNSTKPLSGIRVLELSRVLAAPIAGRTLAAYGADVVWVTGPNLPDLPSLDKDTARGKRTVQLDLETEGGREALRELVRGADVFVQGYRPGAVEGRGFGVQDVVGLVEEVTRGEGREGVVYAGLSAYGGHGEWRGRRGFDSIVQTQSGINVAEARAYEEWMGGKGGGTGNTGVSKVLPCQALDHASGYFLAFGIMAALYRRATDGGSYKVEVSLAATMQYLKSLGRLEGKEAWQCVKYETQGDVPEEFLETKESGFGTLKAVKHSASIDGVDVGWNIMPKPLGSDEARWL